MNTDGQGQVELVALRAWTADLPLRTALHHAKVDTDTLCSVVVEVTTASGSVGMAEVRANGGYATGEDVDDIHRALAALTLPGPADDAARGLLEVSRLAAMAVDVAAWDARARDLGRSLSSVWGNGATMASTVRTHAQIGFGDGPREAAQAVASGYDRLKVRVGSGDAAHDAVRVRTLAEAAPHAGIIVDANGAWSRDETLVFAERLGDLSLAWLEQPTADVSACAGLRDVVPWPLVADESARGPESIDALVGIFDGVHLKLEKAGTVERLDATARAARHAGLTVHLGQMDQGRLGCAVTTQLAAALGLDRAELWGCAHLADDLTWDLHESGGLVTVPTGPGTGVTVTNDHLLEELST